MTDQEQEQWQEPWPEKMYLLHPSIKTFGAMVSNPERREYVRADRIEELVKERDDLRNFDDYFRSVCGFKRDGRNSSKCLDDFLAGINRQDIHVPFDHFLQVQEERGELKSRIEQLENSLAWYQMMDAMSSDHVVELTEKLEAAEAKLTKAVEAVKNLKSQWHIRDLVNDDFNTVLAELEKTE